MKKYFKIAVILFSGLFFWAGSAMALPLTTSSMPVLMIDGVSDNDKMVDIASVDVGNDFDFGFINASNNFQTIVAANSVYSTCQFDGGSVIDFAIRDSANNITRASEGTAVMYFSGDIDASLSANPIVDGNYWQNLTITWTSGNNDMVVNLKGVDDGFAPAPVPEPATMLLLGSGLIGLAGMGRKKFFKK